MNVLKLAEKAKAELNYIYTELKEYDDLFWYLDSIVSSDPNNHEPCIEELEENELPTNLCVFTDYTSPCDLKNFEEYQKWVINTYDISLEFANKIVEFCSQINDKLEYYECSLFICEDRKDNQLYFHKEFGVNINFKYCIGDETTKHIPLPETRKKPVERIVINVTIQSKT